MKQSHNNLRPTQYAEKAKRSPEEKAMYLRRRIAVGSVALVAVTGLSLGITKGVEAVAAHAGQELSSPLKASSETSHYQLGEGDSLWTAAMHVERLGNKHVDPRDIVELLERMPENVNGAGADNLLEPGEVIVIPTSVEAN